MLLFCQDYHCGLLIPGILIRNSMEDMWSGGERICGGGGGGEGKVRCVLYCTGYNHTEVFYKQ